jgi:hypothetical protein
MIENEQLTDTSGFAIHSMKFQNRVFHLIDTPGFDNPGRSECETPNEIAFLFTAADEFTIRFSGIIYIHPITDPRIQGTALRSLNILKTLCGPENYRGLVMATNRWDEITQNQKSNAQSRQLELSDKDRFWGDIKRAGGHVTTSSTSRDDALAILTHFINNDVTFRPAFQYQLIIEQRPISDTDTGRLIYKAILDRYNEDMAKLKGARIELQQEVQSVHFERKTIKAYTEEFENNMQAQILAMQKLRTNAQTLLQSRRANLNRNLQLTTIVDCNESNTGFHSPSASSTIDEAYSSREWSSEPLSRARCSRTSHSRYRAKEIGNSNRKQVGERTYGDGSYGNCDRCWSTSGSDGLCCNVAMPNIYASR